MLRLGVAADRSVRIPKPDGRERLLGIASLEDKIVQQAVVWVLQAIYEQDFVGFSYGFRPSRSQHDALDALNVAITSKRVNWILDADIEGFSFRRNASSDEVVPILCQAAARTNRSQRL